MQNGELRRVVARLPIATLRQNAQQIRLMAEAADSAAAARALRQLAELCEAAASFTPDQRSGMAA